MAGSSSSARVLIVDDEPQVRNALARLLRTNGLEPVVAATGEEALALAEGAGLQAVISDLNMPGMGGIVMLQRLSPLQPRCRFVVLTGEGPVDTDLLPAGHKIRVLHKPWVPSELLTAVRGKRTTGRSTIPPPRRISKTRVLLVEGDPGDALLTTTALGLTSDHQYLVSHCTTLEAALERLTRETFDVACVEVALPDSKGLNAVLKLQAAAPELGIVVLSHLDDEALALQAVQAGAQDFLVKGQVGGAAVAKAMRYAQERKRAEQRLSEMAFHDQLTGLANRTLFRQRIAQALVHCRESQRGFAVLVLDVDRFKSINDALGHDAGDAFLQQVAERLRHVTREGETVARLGGDEFAILARNVRGEADVRGLCSRVLQQLRAPLEINNTRLKPTSSIGAALFPDSGQDSDALLSAADAAMYVAKSEGRNRFHLHGVELSESSARRVELEHQLRIAVERRDFELYYQPQVDPSGRWIRAEALLRWKRADLPPVSADKFVPLLEETGLILELGPWLIAKACRQLRRWQDAGCPVERIGINISATQFAAGDVVGDVRRAVQAARLHPSSVELELTETALLANNETIREKLLTLAADGYHLALDDFGTGYCSLAYLREFPISTVKIDKSFVREIATDVRLRELVGAIVHLARRLGLEVIAEGVEDEAQVNVLNAQRCQLMQGYLFGRALPADEFRAYFVGKLPTARSTTLRKCSDSRRKGIAS